MLNAVKYNEFTRIGQKMTIIKLILICTFIGLFHNANAEKISYIAGNDINVRTTPKVADNIKFVQKNGWQSVQVLATKQGQKYQWSKIQFPNKKTGWVVSDFIVTLDSDDTDTIKQQYLDDNTKAIAQYDIDKIKLVNSFFVNYLESSVDLNIAPTDLLFAYAEKQNNTYVWKLVNMTTKRTVEWYRTDKKLFNIIRDPQTNRIYFQAEDTLMYISLNNYKKINYIGYNTQQENSWRYPEIWISIDRKTMYRKYGVEIGSSEFAIVDKKSISDTHWVQVEKTSSSFEGYAAQRYSVLKSTSDDFLLNEGKNTKKFNGLLGASREGDLIGLPKFVSKNDLSKFSNPNYSELSQNIGLLTSSSVGDSQHLEPPIAIIDGRDKSITFIAKNRINNSINKALEIQTIGEYLLIADEYSFDNFVIYNIKTKKIILKANSSSNAQWL